jgi:hypothetical protein
MEVFDKLGALRTDFDEAEIASLDGDQRQRFDTLRAAATAAATAEAELKEAHDLVRLSMQQVQDARAHIEKVRPRVTEVQAARDWIASQRAEALAARGIT